MKRTIYIMSDGKLRKRNNTMQFLDREGNKKHTPVENIRSIMVFGSVTITKELLELFTRKNILVHYFNFHGYYIGTFYPRERYASGLVLLRQVEHYLDPAKRILLARKFVEGAIFNIIRNLQYYARQGVNLEGRILEIEALKAGLNSAQRVDEVMAIEGNVRDIYYRCFDEILRNEDFRFQHRTKRPPQNRLNALMSFGNSLLYITVLSEIYKTHLDPRIGYLHATNRRHFTLALDIAEVFKPLLVDRLIFNLINKNMIRPSHFVDGSDGVFLNKKALKMFTEEWEDRLNATVYHRNLKRKISYRYLVRIEAYKIMKHVLGDKEYSPYVTRR